MSEAKRRNNFSAEFKAKVSLEAIKGERTINEIGLSHGVHPVQVSQWKREVLDGVHTLFNTKRGPVAAVAAHQAPEVLFGEIGRLKMELDWLKKKSGISQ